jgi:uncharacterized protein (TIGR02452 family)
MNINYREINRKVMTDTKHQYENDEELQQSIRKSIKAQFMVSQEERLDYYLRDEFFNTEYIVTGGRSFEEAQKWAVKGKKVAVLNFANNHSIGGAPFSAGAQEESLCRCSTLLPCLEAMNNEFYQKHIRQYRNGDIDFMGNDDLIYTPNVCVFKTDESTDPVIPRMMPRDEWYNVDIITCAAPELKNNPMPSDYGAQIESRISKILSVALKQGVEVFVFGAWGCGAFGNPEERIASLFFEYLRYCNFETVVVALGRKDYENSEFAKIFSYALSDKEKICRLLKSTNRENVDKVIDFLEERGFFEAPASVSYHNNCKGGLAKHSLDVYYNAIISNQQMNLPESSVIICSLLHDVCKIDQYAIDNGLPIRNEENIRKGHGRRSMFILKRRCLLPLNYDEEMAIWWHMGEHEESIQRFAKEYQDSLSIKLCQLIRNADEMAAKEAML